MHVAICVGAHFSPSVAACEDYDEDKYDEDYDEYDDYYEYEDVLVICSIHGKSRYDPEEAKERNRDRRNPYVSLTD
jgi:hypothetical protein